MRVLNRVIRRIVSTLRFGWLTLWIAGPRVFLRQLRHQLYGRAVFIGHALDLSEQNLPTPEGICYLRIATPDEVEEFFQKMNEEDRESRYQLLVRRWFYECGFRRVIIGWTADTHEMCHIRWIVTAQDIRDTGFEGRLPELQEGDVLSENTYTLERFRRRGIQYAAGLQLIDILRKLGFKRTVVQIAENNIPSLISSSKRGGRMGWRVLEWHFLFRVKRTTLERFDPPVPIPVPGENS